MVEIAVESLTVTAVESAVAPAAESDIAQRWHAEIAAAEKWQERFVKHGKDIIKRYRNFDHDEFYGKSGFNILWANVETLKPVLYSRTPKPQIARRNAEDDDVGRLASQVLGRCVTYNLGAYDFDAQMRRIISDFLLVGRGQAWLRYSPTIENGELTRETVYCDAVFWRDFLHSPARHWDEVRWVARRVYMTRAALTQRFGPRANSVPLDHAPDEFSYSGNALALPETFRRATIWEIWDKDGGEVIFLAKGAQDQLLERRPPFIAFTNFFPCPRPLLATTGAIGGRNDQGIVPAADYLFYRKQALEIDQLTNKISQLLRAVRMVGVYNAAAKELGSLLSDQSAPNEMIPVHDWPFLQQAGGLRGVVDFLPVDQAVGILTQCYQAREQAKAAVYEITGISDIVRGESAPTETATAVALKSQYGAVRVRERQAEVQRFSRDIVRLMGEVIAEVFSPQSLIEQSGVKLLTEEQKAAIQAQLQFQQQQAALVAAAQQQQAASGQSQATPGPGVAANGSPPAVPTPPPLPPPPPPALPPEIEKQLALPSWDQIGALLRDDKLRSFSIEIETDSTIAVDRQQAQQQRLEFVRAVNDLLTGAGPLIGSAPELAQLVRETILYAVRSFQVGGELEESIEQALDAIGQRLAQPQPQGGDPTLAAAQGIEQMRLQIEQQKLQLQQQELAQQAQGNQIEAQLRALSLQIAQQGSINEGRRITIAEQDQLNEQRRIEIAAADQANEDRRIRIAEQRALNDTVKTASGVANGQPI